jgi:hypothetical protein
VHRAELRFGLLLVFGLLRGSPKSREKHQGNKKREARNTAGYQLFLSFHRPPLFSADMRVVDEKSTQSLWK